MQREAKHRHVVGNFDGGELAAVGEVREPLATVAALVRDGTLPGHFFVNQLQITHVQTYPIFCPN